MQDDVGQKQMKYVRFTLALEHLGKVKEGLSELLEQITTAQEPTGKGEKPSEAPSGSLAELLNLGPEAVEKHIEQCLKMIAEIRSYLF